MYTNQTKSMVRAWAKWLNTFPWDYFSTVTYRFDVKASRNVKIIEGLIEYLRKKQKSFLLFWVMEFTHSGNTHNHFLVQGKNVDQLINEYLLSRGLVDKRFVRHMDYDKSKGAAHYVVKYISSKEIEYDFIQYSDTKIV